MEPFATYPADYILITLSTTYGAHLALSKALEHWNRLYNGVLEHGFLEAKGKGAKGTTWAMFNPDLSSGALDDLTCLFEFSFAPAPVAWEYIPAFYADAA